MEEYGCANAEADRAAETAEEDGQVAAYEERAAGEYCLSSPAASPAASHAASPPSSPTSFSTAIATATPTATPTAAPLSSRKRQRGDIGDDDRYDPNGHRDRQERLFYTTGSEARGLIPGQPEALQVAKQARLHATQNDTYSSGSRVASGEGEGEWDGANNVSPWVLVVGGSPSPSPSLSSSYTAGCSNSRTQAADG